MRVSEVGEHAIAHVARHIAGVLLDDRRGRVLIGTVNVAKIFGVQPLRQFRRPHQVSEHHSQLPALGLRGRRRVGRGSPTGIGRLRGLERPNRFQQLLARTKCETHALEVRLLEFRQNLEINLVLGEQLRVFSQPVLLEPSSDIDHGLDHTLTILVGRGLRILVKLATRQSESGMYVRRY
jgi:hypothetical protein